MTGKRRYSDLPGRIIAALKHGKATVAEVSQLINVPSESTRQCMQRLAREGKISIVEKRSMGAFKGHVKGAPLNVYALPTPPRTDSIGAPYALDAWPNDDERAFTDP